MREPRVDILARRDVALLAQNLFVDQGLVAVGVHAAYLEVGGGKVVVPRGKEERGGEGGEGVGFVVGCKRW